MKTESSQQSFDTPSEHERNLEDSNATTDVPGAFHVGGEFFETSSANSYQSTEDICEGRVLVLDGVVVPPPLKPKRKYLEIIGIISFMSLVFVIVKLVEKLSNEENFENHVQYTTTYTPSMSPSASSQPTTYVQTMLRDIVISVSGEEKLNDPTTPQYYCFMKLIKNIPYLEEMLFLDKKDRIVQRYVILLITLSFSSDFIATYELQLDRRLPDECVIFECNEREEITAIVFQDEWMTPLGGGTIASEIGFLVGLNYLIIDNNELRGTLPTEIGNLSNLKLIDIARNNLSGTIPTQLGSLTRLNYLFLDCNNFTNTIPSEIGNIIELNYANFSKNSLSGIIPSTMGRLYKLKSLSFVRTDINGSADFLCNNHFTRTMVSEEIVIGMSFYTYHEYEFSAYSGIVMPCPVIDTSPLCSCCICNEI